MNETKRRLSARSRVLERLEQGPATNVDLNAICYRYGARILELRQTGRRISTTPTGRRGGYVYRLEQ